jgi:hypothetical protein
MSPFFSQQLRSRGVDQPFSPGARRHIEIPPFEDRNSLAISDPISQRKHYTWHRISGSEIIMKSVALYIRVSTSKQDTENQRRELEAVVDRSGWKVVKVYEDAGISGAKGRVSVLGLTP